MMSLNDMIIKITIFLLAMVGIGSLIVYFDPATTKSKKKCLNCFWLYNSEKTVFCQDPNPPIRNIQRKHIRTFSCSRHWWDKKKEEVKE